MPTPVSPPFATHCVVPFAASLSEPCLHALPRLDATGVLPNLRQLLVRLRETARTGGDEYALSMPHERVLASEMGWSDGDGLLPWAAWWAIQDGLTLDPARTWGLLSPGHWLMGRDHLTLLDPHTMGLTESESKALLEAIRPLFESDGWTLTWGATTRWYASHDSLKGLPTASLDRVIGRNPDLWLTDAAQARMVRRLQSEVQMMLYQHPINDQRDATGLATVNSFWLSGCGPLPASTAWPATTHLVPDLRESLLADDMPTWLDAWAQLDRTLFQQLRQQLDAGQDVRLTLCGDRHAATLTRQPAAGIGSRLWQSVRRLTGSAEGPGPSAVLATL